MTDLHVIYRLEQRVGAGDPEQWATSSYPVSVYVAGSDIAEVRAEFREAWAELLRPGSDERHG